MTNFFTNKFRTSTLYDFSSVTKAVIFVFSIHHGTVPGEDIGYDLKEVLPVQINPSDIERKNGIDTDGRALDTSQSFSGFGNRPHRRESKRDLLINLKFDILDEYNIVTMKGKLPTNTVSLDENTIISSLFKHFGPHSYRMLFSFGNINFLGFLSRLTCRYNCFSAYGEPLKADVEMTLEDYAVEEKLKGGPEKMLGIKNWAEVKAYKKSNEIFVRLQKNAEEIASSTLPSIVRKMRE
ncbi:MAG: hypothetical protein FWC41_00665 [Firmicutes bacterium]|nr:hypothetical protein [Bacillota bacterium]